MTLRIKARLDRLHEVWIEDKPECCDAATELNAAIGRLIRRFPELFNVEQILLEQETYSRS